LKGATLPELTHFFMSRDPKEAEETFGRVAVDVLPGQEKTVSFCDHPDFLCTFTAARRTQPESTGKVELFAVTDGNSDHKNKIAITAFKEGEGGSKEIGFTLTEEDDVKFIVVGESGITIEGEFSPPYFDEEEEEEEQEEAGE
jgi:hypothetical protein